MTTRYVVAVLALLWAGVAVGGGSIDLDQPGALQALQQSNPAHYEKVRKIMDGVLRQPEAAVPRWIQTTFAAENVSYAPIVLTSHPPKRRLSFALDDTRYEVVLTLTNVRGQIIPAR